MRVIFGLAFLNFISMVAFNSDSFAMKDSLLRVPPLNGHLENLTTLSREQIQVFVHGSTYKQTFGDGSKRCTTKESKPLILNSDDTFALTEELIVPPCKDGWPNGSSGSIKFSLNPEKSPDAWKQIKVLGYYSSKIRGPYPKEFTLVEMPELFIPITMDDNSDPIEWLKKNGSSFLITLTPANGSAKGIQINEDENISQGTAVLSLKRSFFSFPMTSDTEMVITVTVGQLGLGRIFYSSQRHIALKELVTYLSNLPVVLRSK